MSLIYRAQHVQLCLLQQKANQSILNINGFPCIRRLFVSLCTSSLGNLFKMEMIDYATHISYYASVLFKTMILMCLENRHDFSAF